MSIRILEAGIESVETGKALLLHRIPPYPENGQIFERITSGNL